MEGPAGLDEPKVDSRPRSKREPRPVEEIAARDQGFGIRSFVAAWKKQQDAGRKMREKYANRLIGVLVFQVLLVNVFFALIGFRVGGFEAERWTAQTFLITTFLEISSLVLIVAKYLFPAPTDKALEVIAGLGLGAVRRPKRRRDARPGRSTRSSAR